MSTLKYWSDTDDSSQVSKHDKYLECREGNRLACVTKGNIVSEMLFNVIPVSLIRLLKLDMKDNQWLFLLHNIYTI